MPRVTELDLKLYRYSKIRLSRYLGYRSWLICLLMAQTEEKLVLTAQVIDINVWTCHIVRHSNFFFIIFRFELSISFKRCNLSRQKFNTTKEVRFQIPSQTLLPEYRGNQKHENKSEIATQRLNLFPDNQPQTVYWELQDKSSWKISLTPHRSGFSFICCIYINLVTNCKFWIRKFV